MAVLRPVRADSANFIINIMISFVYFVYKKKGKDLQLTRVPQLLRIFPHKTMIQENKIAFNLFLKNHPNIDILKLTFDDAVNLTSSFNTSIESSTKHTFLGPNGKTDCRSHSFTYKRAYIRKLVTCDKDGTIQCNEIKIPVFYCATCKHFHAALPYLVIIPYLAYSIQFVLNVFIDRFQHHMTVEAVLEKYNLSKTTYYRLLKKAKYYFRIYCQIRDSYNMSLFLDALNDPFDLLKKIYIKTNNALLEEDRRLHHHPPLIT